MAHVQGPRGVGRNKLHHHFLARVGAAAKGAAGSQDLGDNRLFGVGLQTQVDEARACNFKRLNPALKSGLHLQQGDELCGEFTRVFLGGFGELHGRCDGEVAMRCKARRFEGDGQVGITARWHQFAHRNTQCRQQILLGLDHRGILLLGLTRRLDWQGFASQFVVCVWAWRGNIRPR